MKKFYRVQTDTNEGPYHDQEFSLQEYLPNGFSRDYMATRPTAYNDLKIDKNFSDSFKFGFNTKRKLIKWFSYSTDPEINETAYFKKYGFYVYEYNATEVFSSTFQSIALMDNLTFVRKYNFEDFCKLVDNKVIAK